MGVEIFGGGEASGGERKRIIMEVNRVTKKNKCPICGAPDWCGVAADNSAAFCMRVYSPKQAKNGAFIHALDNEQIPKIKNQRSKIKNQKSKTIQRTSAELNEIYSEFLAHLVLAKNHEADLIKRGLDLTDIHLHGYKSNPTPVFASQICQRLIKAGFNLSGAPGFFKYSDWQFRTYSTGGFLIPIRNQNLEITALQLRLDNAEVWQGSPKYLLVSSADKPFGASSGTPPHFATVGNLTPNSQVKSIIVTEGALKANIIQKFTGKPVVGLVGIGTFDAGFPRLLKSVFPNLKKCQIAFDREKFDAAKPTTCAFAHVRRHRARLVEYLRNENLQALVLSWNADFKGMDDFLAARVEAQAV